MENKKIDKISVMVEIDGQVCAVVLDDTAKTYLIGILSSLSPNGVIKVAKLSNEYKFDNLDENDIDPS